MNLCFIVYDFSKVTGGHKALYNVTNELKKSGHEIKIISLFYKNHKASFNSDLEIVNLIDGEGRFINNVFPALLKLRHELNKTNIDLFISNGFSANLITFLSSVYKRKRFIVWEHMSLSDINYKDFKSNLYRFIGAVFAEKIIVLTNQGKEDYIKRFKIKSNKIRVIPNFININKLAIKNPSSVKKRIITVGRLDPVKGLDRLLDVAKLVNKKLNGWKWEVWGFEKDELQLFQEQVHQNGLENFIILKEKTTKIEEIYNYASLYVMTSYYEGFPLVLLESLSFNIPVVAFDIPDGPKDIIVNGVNGFLVKDGDIEEMASLIHNILTSKNKLYGLRKMIPFTSSKFSKENIIWQWNQLLSGD